MAALFLSTPFSRKLKLSVPALEAVNRWLNMPPPRAILTTKSTLLHHWRHRAEKYEDYIPSDNIRLLNIRLIHCDILHIVIHFILLSFTYRQIFIS